MFAVLAETSRRESLGLPALTAQRVRNQLDLRVAVVAKALPRGKDAVTSGRAMASSWDRKSARIAAALLSGALLHFTVNLTPWWPAAWVAPAPLLLASFHASSRGEMRWLCAIALLLVDGEKGQRALFKQKESPEAPDQARRLAGCVASWKRGPEVHQHSVSADLPSPSRDTAPSFDTAPDAATLRVCFAKQIG